MLVTRPEISPQAADVQSIQADVRRLSDLAEPLFAEAGIFELYGEGFPPIEGIFDSYFTRFSPLQLRGWSIECSPLTECVSPQGAENATLETPWGHT